MPKNKKLIQNLKEIFDNYIPTSDDGWSNKRANISYIDIEFSGSGDSGAVDFISLMTKEWEEMINEANQKLENPYRFTSMISQKASNHKSWEYLLKNGYQDNRTNEFHEKLEDFIYDFLEETGHDWCNNEGGQGNIRIIFDEYGDINIKTSIGVNYSQTEDHNYEDNYKITTKKVTKKTANNNE